MNKPTPEELVYLASIRTMKRYGNNDRAVMYGVYNRIFGTDKRPTSCGRCLSKTHKELMNVYNQYKNEDNGKSKLD
jgi:hypothetical protein